MIHIEENYPLQSLNTFGIKAYARIFAEASTPDDLRSLVRIFRDETRPRLILGGGSNILFTGDFDGIIIYPDIKGIEILKETDNTIFIRAFAGEEWDRLVEYCVSRNWGGLENLSLIPGNTGACPIQNIGAYGVEVKDVIESVEAMDLETGNIRIFENRECRFGYRDSIFKNSLKGKYIILSVIFRLSKKYEFKTGYKDVAEELKNFDVVTLSTIRQAIINIRSRKLPDPRELGNAGSFFKNPVIPSSHYDNIKERYPDIPSYQLDDGTYKIPAAWLIQSAGWKGVREGNTGSHPSQPLVIVNYGNATGKEIFSFAKKIQHAVGEIFGIELEMEVWII